MKTAYLDCFSGISGDMMVGALIDLGLPREHLEKEMEKLPITGYSVYAGRVRRSGIDSADFRVMVEGGQGPRDYRAIRGMIESSPLKDEVKELSLRIFGLLAEAEGKVHGVDPEDVHFHEVGGLDSIVDIVGTAAGIDYLKIKNLFSSTVVTGTGMVRSDHGLMPVPAPATAEILKGVPVRGTAIEGEMVTPTGAAILKALSKGYGEMPEMMVEKIGYGAGDREFDEHPNLLRIFLGEEVPGTEADIGMPCERDEVLLMEAAIDDMNPQFFEPLVDDLFAAGSLDVTMTPLYMKKGRPGTLLKVLVPPEVKGRAAEIIFRGSTTIGVRCFKAERIKLRRSEKLVETPFGNMKVKVVEKGGGQTELRPEYDELKRLASKEGIPVVEMSDRVRDYLSRME